MPGSHALAKLDLYHYLHQDHKRLVEKVDNVIREMKASGELEQVIQQATRRVLAGSDYEKSANSGTANML